MDYNYLLLRAHLTLGRYDAETRTFEVRRIRRLLNSICIAVNVICALKIAIMMFGGDLELFYLNEVYIVRGDTEKCKFSIEHSFLVIPWPQSASSLIHLAAL